MTIGHEVTIRPDPLQSRGWTSVSTDCAPKQAALASLLELAAPQPVASVSYQSRGNVLVVAGDSESRARDCAAALARDLQVTLLGAAAPSSAYATWPGRVESLDGFLGAFTVTLAKLDGAAQAAPARFDLILDFSREPLFAMRQPPQGYYPAPASDQALADVLDELRASVGEFEKPRYFAYRVGPRRAAEARARCLSQRRRIRCVHRVPQRRRRP